jgi:hypothetical protein
MADCSWSFLKKEELHESYRDVSHEEAIVMANIGAECYYSAKKGLITQLLEVKESSMALSLKEEGRLEALEVLNEKLKASEEMAVQLKETEGIVSYLQAKIDDIVDKQMEAFRMSCENEKLKEIATLKEQIAHLRGRVADSESRDKYVAVMEDSYTSLKAKYEILEEKTRVKSSTQIGKEGEAELLDMLETILSEEFDHGSVTNTAGKCHMGDFHLFVMGVKNRRVKIIIDSKKFTKHVPSSEIDKLHRDVDDDEEADAGLLISHTSNISTAKPFKIDRTKRNRPVLYISFYKLDEETKRKMLVWAVRTLQHIASEKTYEEQTRQIEKIEELLYDLSVSVEEFDSAIRKQKLASDAITFARNKLVSSITAFRSGNRSHTLTVADLPDDNSVEVTNMESICTAITKKSGVRCSRLTVTGGAYCSSHMPKTGN